MENHYLCSMQKRFLHQLLMIKDDPERIDSYINLMKAEMDFDDVAYVENMIMEREE